LPQSGEFQINTYTPLNQTLPVIAADGQGNFVVVWEQQDSTPAPDNIIARRFNSSGAGLGLEFLVNVFTAGVQRVPWGWAQLRRWLRGGLDQQWSGW
jgi:hypothetical protein